MTEAKINSVLDQLDQLEEIVLDGSRIPFSGGRLVNEQDAIEVMDAVREALPGQLAQAEELIRKKEEFITQARQQADEMVSQARQQREQLISSQSVRQEAERRAGRRVLCVPAGRRLRWAWSRAQDCCRNSRA